MMRTQPGRGVFSLVRALGAEMGKKPLNRVNCQRFIFGTHRDVAACWPDRYRDRNHVIDGGVDTVSRLGHAVCRWRALRVRRARLVRSERGVCRVGDDTFDDRLSRNPIAVVGLAGTFSSARDVREFWRDIMIGTDRTEHCDPDPFARTRPTATTVDATGRRRLPEHRPRERVAVASAGVPTAS